MKIPIYSADELKYGEVVLVVVEALNQQGDVRAVEWGSAGFVPSSSGMLLVMEEKYVNQLDKFRLSIGTNFQPQLTLKEGADFEEPVEDEFLKRKRELEKEMKKLQEEEYIRENNLDNSLIK